MFSNTAFEAIYQYLGLQLHSQFIEVITSQKIFVGTLLMIFSFLFFITTAQFFSRYIPGTLIHTRRVPLSKFVKIIACLFLGLSVLRVGTTTSVRKFNGDGWDTNPYVKAQYQSVQSEYRVSLVFDVLSRTAEETSALISRIIDKIFQSGNSQLDAPNFFFKAILYGGAATIDDPDLKASLNYYTEDCFDRLLPYIKSQAGKQTLDSFFGDDSEIDQKLQALRIETRDQSTYTCLDMKNDVRDRLQTYATSHAGSLADQMGSVPQGLKSPFTSRTQALNLYASSALANHYLDQREDAMGIQKGAMLPTTGGHVFEYLSRFMSWDGFLSAMGDKGQQGAALAARRSLEFSENLARAPHLAGFIKMLLIAIFPWLMFAVVAGYWRVLVFWFMLYFSVLLWTPIWTLLYHIMVGISQSAETMEAFGKLSDGVSLYSAELVTSRMYHLYEVYSWLQVLTGTLFTGFMLYFLKPALSDTHSDSSPEFISDSQRAVSTAGSVAGAML